MLDVGCSVFLLLLMPFLTFPLALLALATLPALTAIYILRNRFRRRQVSSLMLWRFRVQSKEGGVKLHRLQLPLLFFLELLALLLLVTAAVGPQWKMPQSARPLVVVLDDSFSMRAVRDGVSTRARAREFLRRLFQRQPPLSTRFILAGTEVRLLGPAVRTWAEADESLKQWQCWSPEAQIESALKLAAELGRQQANFLVLTDHKPADDADAWQKTSVAGRIEWHAFGKAVDNLAIVTASRTVFGELDRCLIEVANFSEAERRARLVVQAGTNVAQNSLVSVPPRERSRLVFNVAAATPELQVSLEPDGLAEDNVAKLLPSIRKKVRVQVALSDTNLNDLAVRTLDATGLRAALTENPELVIHQVSTPVLASNAWSLRWNSPTESTAFTGPFLVDGSHPLAQGVTLQGVVWSAAVATNALGEVPVILAGNTPLLSVREDVAGRRHLALNLNPKLSTLPGTPDWPVLFWNLLQWRATETPGLHESNARLGSEILLKTTGEPVTVTWPNESQHTFPKPAGELALETPMPGVYSVAMSGTTNQFAVNLLAAEESDLRDSTSGRWGDWGAESDGRREQASVSWLFGLFALVILAAHLYLVAVGKGGR